MSINGMDVAGKHYFGRLDQGDYDVGGFVKRARAAGYRGPFGLQGFKVEGDPAENLERSMKRWKEFAAK
jgi:sugar phosphate isomerase/epimerase